MPTPSWLPRHRPSRRQAVLGAFAAGLLLLWLLFDWNWFRGPLEHVVSERTQREFRVGDLDVDLGWHPVIRLRDVYFANAPWTRRDEPMARIGLLEFSVSLRGLWDGEVFVPHVALSQAQLVMVRAPDGRRNWTLKEPERAAEPSRLRISSLSVEDGRLRFEDQGMDLAVDVAVDTVAPKQQGAGTARSVPSPEEHHGTLPPAPAAVTAASAPASTAASATATSAAPPAGADPGQFRYSTRYRFQGSYRNAGFQGEAWSGDVLSFQQSDVPFALKGHVQAGSTRLDAEGTVADLAQVSAIDMRVRLQGRTLASLYPFLLLPLPDSPAYSLSAHLQQSGTRYRVEELQGRIGHTDMAGRADYEQREPRPLLRAQLQSKLLDITDLGPFIGLEDRATAAGVSAPPRSAATPASRTAGLPASEAATAQAAAVANADDRVLPQGRFDGERLRVMDADVAYAAARLQAPDGLAVENMRFHFRLDDGVAKLAPLEFGFARGHIVSEITIDGREPVLRTTLASDFRNLQLDALFPTLPDAAQGVGAVGAQIRLSGAGNSIAEAAAVANGTLTAAISRGRLSNLLDAVAGLNGGKILTLLVGGDRDIAINCGAASFEVRSGIGQSRFFAIDTAQTRIDGSGSFNLKDESLDLRIEPQPKSPGILSLRSPLYVRGNFRNPDAGVEKGPLVARAAGAVALGLVNPLAALLPLIESGPGTDVDCARVLAPVQGARQQAGSRSRDVPQARTPAGTPSADAKPPAATRKQETPRPAPSSPPAGDR